MSATAPTDPKTLVESLDADAIRQRLDELAGEQHALRVLLRAADRRNRYSAKKAVTTSTAPTTTKGGK